MAYKGTLIPGDGIGPELIETTVKVVSATGIKFEWEIQNAGLDVLEKEGTPLPPAVLQSIRKNKIALKGPITTPIGTGFRSVNVAIRKELDLYACLRPCKSYKGVASKFGLVDLIVVRENTEDLYAGVEFEQDSAQSKAIIELSNGRVKDSSAISIKPISKKACEKIVRYGFEYALKNGRKKVTAIAKANIMKCTDGLFFQTAREVSKDYSEIEYEEKLVDNMCMQLVQKPQNYDVLVLPNLYGDILSDLCAGLIGGLGMAPGANIGDDCAVFEASHGSAPKYKGLNKANPIALIMSAKLMLNYLKEDEAAARLEKAIAATLAEGKHLTYDLGGSASTKEVGMEIIKNLER